MKYKKYMALMLGVVCVSLPSMASAGMSEMPQILNINARWNDSGNPVEVYFDAGTYVLDPIGVADGGLYNSISYGSGIGPNRYKSWRWWYWMESDELGTLWINQDANGGQYIDYEMNALSLAISTQFTLETADTVDFYIGDSYYTDNIGGISLLVHQVPEPATLCILGFGSLMLAGKKINKKPIK